jgi:hypothetical protein
MSRQGHPNRRRRVTNIYYWWARRSRRDHRAIDTGAQGHGDHVGHGGRGGSWRRVHAAQRSPWHGSGAPSSRFRLRPAGGAPNTPSSHPAAERWVVAHTLRVDEQLTPRRSGDDPGPGILPVGPVLWSGRVRAGHPSSPGGPRSGPRRTGRQYPVTAACQCQFPPRQFHDWLTGRQCTCTTRRPSQQRVSTPGGSHDLSTPRWRRELPGLPGLIPRGWPGLLR